MKELEPVTATTTSVALYELSELQRMVTISPVAKLWLATVVRVLTFDNLVTSPIAAIVVVKSLLTLIILSEAFQELSALPFS